MAAASACPASTFNLLDATLEYAQLHARLAALEARYGHQKIVSDHSGNQPMPPPPSRSPLQPRCTAANWFGTDVCLDTVEEHSRLLTLGTGAGEDSCQDPVLSCAYLPSGHIALLHSNFVTLCEACDSASGWRPAVRLQGAAGARFHSLALVHPTLGPSTSPTAVLALCGCIDGARSGASVFRASVLPSADVPSGLTLSGTSTGTSTPVAPACVA